MQVCLFDIDGTLLSSGGAGKAALEAALHEEFGVKVHKHVAYSGRTDRAIIRDILNEHEIDPSTINWERLRKAYLQRLPDSLERSTGRVLPGIAEFVAALNERQIHLGLLTGNIREGAHLKLSHYGLFDHFRFGGFGDLHFERDDVAREALASVRSHVGDHVALDQIWVIGDTPLDVRCARAIGVRVAAVATGWHPVEELEQSKPDLLFTDLSDHSPLLAFLNS